jgi:hypothetical protein
VNPSVDHHIIIHLPSHRYLEAIKLQSNFLGTSTPDHVKRANFIRQNIGNGLPPPDQGLFQTSREVWFEKETWERNMDSLAELIREYVGPTDEEDFYGAVPEQVEVKSTSTLARESYDGFEA